MQLIHNFSRNREPDVDFVFNLLRTINAKIERTYMASYLESIDIKVNHVLTFCYANMY